MDITPKSLAVIGGGISGLSAAIFARDSGFAVTLFEREDDVGGVLQSATFASHNIDLGADAILHRDPLVTTFLERIGISQQQLTQPASIDAWILQNAKLHPFPLDTALGIPRSYRSLFNAESLTAFEKVRAAIRVSLPHRPCDRAESVTSFVNRFFGKAVARSLVGPLLSGIYAGDIDHLDPRIALRDACDASLISPRIFRGFRRMRGSQLNESIRRPTFVAHRGGMAAIVEATKATAQRVSVEIHSSVTIDRVEYRETDSNWLIDGPGLHARIFDAVVIAIAPFETAKLLHTRFEHQLFENWPTASVGMVLLAYPKSAFKSSPVGNGFLVADSEAMLMTACSFASNKWSHLEDDDVFLFRASVGNVANTSWTQMADADVIAKVDQELRSVLEISKPPVSQRLIRWNNSFPQYNHDGAARQTMIEEIETELTGIAFVGNAFGGIGIASCIRHAHTAVNRLKRDFL